MIPGTPDGMFEEHESGALTCVQVVRLPLNKHMVQQQVEKLIYDTILAKVVKSQRWMKATQILPSRFVIFCWLPPLAQGVYPEMCGDRSEGLMDRLRGEGWPFYLRLMVPTEPGDLFPAAFAFHKHGKVGCVAEPRAQKAGMSEADLSTFDPTDFESDDDDSELFEFDIWATSEIEGDFADGDSLLGLDLHQESLARTSPVEEDLKAESEACQESSPLACLGAAEPGGELLERHKRESSLRQLSCAPCGPIETLNCYKCHVSLASFEAGLAHCQLICEASWWVRRSLYSRAPLIHR